MAGDLVKLSANERDDDEYEHVLLTSDNLPVRVRTLPNGTGYEATVGAVTIHLQTMRCGLTLIRSLDSHGDDIVVPFDVTDWIAEQVAEKFCACVELACMSLRFANKATNVSC